MDDDVSMLHEVTLGGTGKITGDRHPKVRRGVLIGAGAKILGNVVIGEGSKVAAGSVVLNDVPPHTTVAGVPAVVSAAPQQNSRPLKWIKASTVRINRIAPREGNLQCTKRSVDRYRSPVSGRIASNRFPRPNSCASSVAACKIAPDDTPHRIPSSSASRCAAARACS